MGPPIADPRAVEKRRVDLGEDLHGGSLGNATFWSVEIEEEWSEPRHEIDTYVPKENLLAVV